MAENITSVFWCNLSGTLELLVLVLQLRIQLVFCFVLCFSLTCISSIDSSFNTDEKQNSYSTKCFKNKEDFNIKFQWFLYNVKWRAKEIPLVTALALHLHSQSTLPLPMISRGCLAWAMIDTASDTAECSAVLMGGGGQHSTYLEAKQKRVLKKKKSINQNKEWQKIKPTA